MSQETLPLLQRIKRARDEMRKWDSINSFGDYEKLPDNYGDKAVINGSVNNMGTNEDLQQTAGSPITKSSSAVGLGNRKLSSQSLNFAKYIIERSDRKRFSVPSFVPPANLLEGRNFEDKNDSTPQLVSGSIMKVATISELKTVEEENRGDDDENENKEDEYLDNNKNSLNMDNKQTPRQSRTNLARRSRRLQRAEGMRPFYRDDIFFSASLLRLPQYTSQVRSKFICFLL